MTHRYSYRHCAFVSSSIVSSSAGRVTVERVSLYKLLGVMISDSLKWDDHVDVITSKAAETLVPETQAGRRICRWPGTLLPNCCKTGSGIRMPSMALQFVKAADKTTWERSKPCSACSALHTQKPVVCWEFSHWLTDVQKCANSFQADC